MANEFGVNLNLANDQWLGIWHLVCRMIKAGYWVRASSDGVTKVVSDDITAHVGSTGTGFAPQSVSNSGSAASIINGFAHPSGWLCTISGMSGGTGLVSPTVAGGNSEGNFLTISGAASAIFNGTHQIYEVHSATSCTVLIRTATSPATTDLNNGAISWTEKSVVGGSAAYGSLAARQWWVCVDGPETHQLSFSTAPSGTFTRGEIVTQATTGATAEVISYVWDAVSSLGWIILMPRMGRMNGTDVITGGTSGVTVTPSSITKFKRQHVFSKGSAANSYTGSSWYQCYNETTEAADAFHTKAAHAACTATVAPGGSTTSGNRGSTTDNWYVIRCNNNSTHDGATALVHSDGVVHGGTTTVTALNGRWQIGVANVMCGGISQSRSADGTWWIFAGNSNMAGGGGSLVGCFRIDGNQDGEAELFCHHAMGYSNSTKNIRDGASTGTGTANNKITGGDEIFYSATFAHCNWPMLYRRASGASAGAVVYGNQYTGLTQSSVAAGTAGGALGRAWGVGIRLDNYPSTLAPLLREPLGIGSGLRGRLRWVFVGGPGINTYDTLESRSLVCFSSPSSAAGYAGFAVGPWDGTSDPVQI